MPLYHNAFELIRANLETLQKGARVELVAIGRFTDEQFETINEHRQRNKMPLLESPEIVFFGSHMYDSRVNKDNYTINDIMLQIQHAIVETSVLKFAGMTALRSTIRRADGYGNMVLDEAVFELTRRKPRAELYSVIPKGDKNKPPKKAAVVPVPVLPVPVLAVPVK